MTTWYRTCSWSDNIEKIEVVRETEKCLMRKWASGHLTRVMKESVDERYFPTLMPALLLIRDRKIARIAELKQQLAQAEPDLADWLSKHPEAQNANNSATA